MHGSTAREAAKKLQEIRHLTGSAEIGVRMHWLYYDQQSPAVLESAGCDLRLNNWLQRRRWDIARAQRKCIKPLECEQLLELPLHVMDTALFLPELSRAFATASKSTDRPNGGQCSPRLEAP